MDILQSKIFLTAVVACGLVLFFFWLLQRAKLCKKCRSHSLKKEGGVVWCEKCGRVTVYCVKKDCKKKRIQMQQERADGAAMWYKCPVCGHGRSVPGRIVKKKR